MMAQTVRLMDSSRNMLAIAHVTDEGDRFGGTIDLCCTPSSLRALFDEYEETVNGQMFVFLDEIQDKISSLALKAVFENGAEMPTADLQVYPSTGDVSFKLVKNLSRSASDGS